MDNILENNHNMFDLLNDFSDFESVKLDFFNFDNGILNKESYTAKEVFSFDGIDKGKELRVSSFSFGTKFFTKAIQLFDKTIVLCGLEEIIPYSIKHSNNIGGFQNDLIQKLTNSDEKIITEYIKNGKLELYIPTKHLFHGKYYLMNFDDNNYRLYTGSSNFSDSAHSLRQGEVRLISNRKENYDVFNDIFEKTKIEDYQVLSPDVYKGVKDDGDFLNKHPEKVPIYQKGKQEKIIYIDNNYINDKDEDKKYDFRVASENLLKLQEEEKKLPKPRMTKNNEMIITEEYINKVCTTIKQRFFKKEEQAQIVEYPLLEIDYESESMYMNGKEFNKNPLQEDIKKCFELLNFYFDGIDKYTTELDKNKILETKKEIFKFLVWGLMSVFIGKIRYLGDKYNAMPIDIYPKIGFVLGEGSNGKTGFIKILTKLITGQVLDPLDKSLFSREELDKKQIIKTCCPIIFDDIDKAIDGVNFEKLIKDDVYGIKTEKNDSNYSPVIFTTNKKLDITKDQIIRRVFFSSTQCRKLNTKRLYNEQYNLDKTIEDLGNTALFSKIAYSYVLPKLTEISEKYRQKEELLPYALDFYKVVSFALNEEFKSAFNTSDVPEYYSIYTINDLRFLDKASEETKKKLNNWLITSPNLFEEREDYIIISDPINNREIKKLKFPPYMTIEIMTKGINVKKNELEQFLERKIELKKGLFGFFK